MQLQQLAGVEPAQAMLGGLAAGIFDGRDIGNAEQLLQGPRLGGGVIAEERLDVLL
jgi:hypothetical protein